MWKRRTFHDCALELEQVSTRFRNAYSRDETDQERISDLNESSIKGVEILRILALSIRSEQDYSGLSRQLLRVGSLITNITEDELKQRQEQYIPPYYSQTCSTSLQLREALNKIAHADPSKAGFYADKDRHDLLLGGKRNLQNWLAIISIIDLCNVVLSLPDEIISSD